MKVITQALILVATASALTACVEDQAYVSDYRSGYVTPYSDQTTGYNRDYQRGRRPNESAAGYTDAASGKSKYPDPSTYENTNKNPDAPDVGYQTKQTTSNREG